MIAGVILLLLAVTIGIVLLIFIKR
jgi:septal ring-binding cell division protein DamX